MTNDDVTAAKYRAATEAGLSGSAAADFAECLTGETADEVRANADRLVNLINGITAVPEDKPDRATDHSQAHGMSPNDLNNPLEDFRFKMIEVFRR